MIAKTTEFEIGNQKYKLEFTRGNIYGHHCFSLYITKDLEDLPIVSFYKSCLTKEAGITLSVKSSHLYNISVKEGKRIILNYLINENI